MFRVSRSGPAAAMSGRLILLVLLLGAVPGCINLQEWADAANARQQQSCVYVQGGYGMFLAVRIVSATGGLPLEVCLGQR